MSRPGWNKHGWWVGPEGEEPEQGRPPRARCGGPKLCVLCGSTATTFAPDPYGLPVTSCKFCHEPIVWAETMPNPRARSKTGLEVKLVPFDAEPYKAGTWALTRRTGQRPLCGEMTRTKADAFRAAGQPTYQKHVKTCTRVVDWPKGEFIAKARERSR